MQLFLAWLLFSYMFLAVYNVYTGSSNDLYTAACEVVNLFALCSLLFAPGFTYADETVTVTATNSDISENLDLRMVATLFGQAKDLEEFERILNTPDSAYSNLDLNGDGDVDYLRVGKRPPLGIRLKYMFYEKTVYALLKKTIGLENGKFFPVAGAAVLQRGDRQHF